MGGGGDNASQSPHGKNAQRFLKQDPSSITTVTAIISPIPRTPPKTTMQLPDREQSKAQREREEEEIDKHATTIKM